MPDPIAYREETADGYAEKFAESCAEPTPTRRGILLSGTCPRCEDAMDFPIVTEVFRAGRQEAAASDTHPLLCTCKSDHPGRPTGDEGCGAYWNITVSDAES